MIISLDALLKLDKLIEHSKKWPDDAIESSVFEHRELLVKFVRMRVMAERNKPHGKISIRDWSDDFQHAIYMCYESSDDFSGPFCEHCWNKHQELISLVFYDHKNIYLCPECKTAY